MHTASRSLHSCWIIPARAGFTWPPSPCPRWSTDHPRSRGVYMRPAWGCQDSAGSSPLARGLQAVKNLSGRYLGIIPARAGFTVAHRRGGRRGRDHPRSRGVYGPGVTGGVSRCGSSPLARGLLAPSVVGGGLDRIIPARAGFTSGLMITASPSTDHPRSRGVYRRCRSLVGGVVGSSPLARGLLRNTFAALSDLRIIPARAGFTWRGRERGSSATDHPRSRGVYTIENTRLMYPNGSSPLARGLLRASACRPRERGIIPARAGFTVL